MRTHRFSAERGGVDAGLFVRDYDKCMMCLKCAQACGSDAQNTFAIAVAGRGFEARIATEHDAPLPDSACVFCGNCVGVCPCVKGRFGWSFVEGDEG